jgi:8-oxo-dGTP diphosphatase
MTYLPKLAVCAFIRNQDGLVLAIDREPKSGIVGDYGLPGGKVEPSESCHEAIKREVSEETGLLIEVGDLLVAGEDAGSYKVYTYFVSRYTGEARSSSEGKVVWIEPARLVSNACTYRVYNLSVLAAAGINLYSKHVPA